MLPKRIGNLKRVNIALLPPFLFLSRGVNVVVVDGTEGNRKLIAHFQTKPARLRIADVMCVGG